MNMVRVSVGIYVGLLIPLVYALPRGRVEGRKAEQATECNATWNACDGPCDHLKEVVEYAAHIEFHNRQVGRKDVLSRVLWGVVKECQNPEYVVFAELAASNCTKQGKRTYAPNECIAIQERPTKYCTIHLIGPRPTGSSQLISYNCGKHLQLVQRESHQSSQIGRKKGAPMSMDARDANNNHYAKAHHSANGFHSFESHPNSLSASGMSPMFLIFCALLPVAGLVILYKIW